MSQAPRTKQFAKGEVVFSQGRVGDVAYIVRTGAIQISRKESGVDNVIALRGPGEVVGEMALVSDANRSATATANMDTTVMVLSRSDIEDRVEKTDPIVRILLLTAFERLRENAVNNNYYVAQ